MRARGWALTDVGLKRDHNEDSFLCNNALGLFAVADGMGGHLGGERASRMAVEILEREIGQNIDQGLIQIRTDGGDSIDTALKQAVTEATRAIWENSQSSPDHAGMGTTLSGILFHQDKATIVHVGDSRVYLYRNGGVRQLTEDHSWIAEQIRAGLLSPDDAITSRFRNIITRSVGFEPTVQPDIMKLDVEAGDCFILCSDGMSNHMNPDEIGRVLASHFYAEAPRAFVDLANKRGGDDNITVIAIYISNERHAPRTTAAD